MHIKNTLPWHENNQLNIININSINKNLIAYFISSYIINYWIYSYFRIYSKLTENKTIKYKYSAKNNILSILYYFFIFYCYNNISFKYTKKFNLNLHLLEYKLLSKFNYLYIRNNKNFNNQLLSNYNIFFSKIITFKEYSLKNILLRERVQFMIFLSQYLMLFLSKKINKKLIIQSSKYHVSELSFFKFKYTIIKKLNNAPNIKRLKIKFKTFIKIIYILLKYKDLEIFKKWIEISMSRLPFKNHRRFLYALKVIFFLYLFPYFKYFNVLGLVIKTSGKIGLGGNSKTRSYYIKAGKYPRTTKSFKILYSQSNIFTLSGALGLSYYFTYA